MFGGESLVDEPVGEDEEFKVRAFDRGEIL
jgi:hypothetical protein